MDSSTKLAQANYTRVWTTFFRNSLVREMMFRGNFLITVVTRGFWVCAQITLFEIIYGNVKTISDWTHPQYYAFMATGFLINSIVEALFMPNCANFSEMIRTGNLDFVLVKPIDTQFLISCEKMELAMLTTSAWGLGLLTYALIQIGEPISIMQVVSYLAFVVVGVTFFYSLMIAMASTSIWLTRNQGLYDFWFYITVFARYPRSIYDGADPKRLEFGEILQGTFTFAVPILLVVTVPARIIAKGLTEWHYPVIGLGSSLLGLCLSRMLFQWSLRSYRSSGS